MLTRLDLLLVVAAMVLMVTGFARRHQMWRQGRPQKYAGTQALKEVRGIVSASLRPANFSQKLYANLAHLFVLWGFIIPLFIVVVSQFKPVWPTWTGVGISLLLDLVGLLALAGTVMLILKRRALKDIRSSGYHLRHWTFLGILLAILVTGFMAEGLRLSLTRDTLTGLSALSSPVGFALCWVMPAWPVFLKIVVRLHVLLVLAFMAAMPYTNMRHAWAAVFNIRNQIRSRDKQPGRTITPIALQGDYFGLGAVNDFTWTQLADSDACMNCGRCNLNCPAHISGKPLMPQGIIREIGRRMQTAFKARNDANGCRAGIFGPGGQVGREDIWACTTCLACVKSCPVFVKHLPDIIGLRRYAVLMESRFPPEYKQSDEIYSASRTNSM